MMEAIPFLVVVACLVIWAILLFFFTSKWWWDLMERWIDGPHPPSLDEWRRTKYDRDMTEARRKTDG